MEKYYLVTIISICKLEELKKIEYKFFIFDASF